MLEPANTKHCRVHTVAKTTDLLNAQCTLLTNSSDACSTLPRSDDDIDANSPLKCGTHDTGQSQGQTFCTALTLSGKTGFLAGLAADLAG